MGIPLDAPLPQQYDLGTQYDVVFTALDPVTGAVNTSVVVSNAVMQVAQVAGSSAASLATPLWIPIPLDEQTGNGSPGSNGGAPVSGSGGSIVDALVSAVTADPTVDPTVSAYVSAAAPVIDTATPSSGAPASALTAANQAVQADPSSGAPFQAFANAATLVLA